MTAMASLLAKDKALDGRKEVAVVRGRERQVLEDGRLYSAVLRAFGLYQRMKALEAEFFEAKEVIKERAGGLAGDRATVSFEADGVLCRVTARCEVTVPEDNVKELRKMLGRRFKDLVSERKRYLGTRKLVEEAAAHQEIRDLLTVRELSPQFSWGITESVTATP